MKLKQAWKMLTYVNVRDPLVCRWLLAKGYKVPRLFFKTTGLRTKLMTKLLWANIYGRRHYLWWALAAFGLVFSIKLLATHLNEGRDDVFYCAILAGTGVTCLFTLIFSWHHRMPVIGEVFRAEQQIRKAYNAQKEAEHLFRVLALQLNAPFASIKPKVDDFERSPEDYATTDFDINKTWTLIEKFGLAANHRPAAPGSAGPQASGSSDNAPKWTEDGEEWKNADD